VTFELCFITNKCISWTVTYTINTVKCQDESVKWCSKENSVFRDLSFSELRCWRAVCFGVRRRVFGRMVAQVSSDRIASFCRASLERFTLKVKPLKRFQSGGDIYPATLCNIREDANNHCQLHCLGRSLESQVSSRGLISVTIYLLRKITT
jgi:hypothetical protein